MTYQDMRRHTNRHMVGSCAVFFLLIATFCPIAVWAFDVVATESRSVDCPAHSTKTSSVSTVCQSLAERLEAVPEHIPSVDSEVRRTPSIEIAGIPTPATPLPVSALVPIYYPNVPLYLLHASLIR